MAVTPPADKDCAAAHPEVMVIGRNCLDHIAVIKTYPKEDTKLAVETRFIEGGGQAGTAACCIARLGGTPVLVGALGDDEEGRFCRARLGAFGVETRHLKTVAGIRTPVAYIFVTRGSGKRTIFYESGGLPPVQFNDVQSAMTSTVNTILLAPDVTQLSLSFADNKPDGVKIIYDCERERDGLRVMMASADYFIPSNDFLTESGGLCGIKGMKEKIARLQQMITGRLVVTCGSDGAYFPDQQHLYHVPTPNIDVVDTLGAGDNFHGAFALAIARGFELKDAVRFAVAVASLSCRDYGGRKGLPDMQQALQTMAQIRERAVQ